MSQEKYETLDDIKKDKISLRYLTNEEYYLLQPEFKKRNLEIPRSNISVVAGAFLENELVGFFVWQLLPHAEPMWIHEDYRNSGVWKELVSLIIPYANMKDTFVVAETEEVEKMCEKMEMEEVKHKVYIRRIK